IPVESGGIKNGSGTCYFFYSGVSSFRWNWRIPELTPECSPECAGTESDRNPVVGACI
ncbi:hypothetical protein M413DRAFT_75852, partial [Hebeloma cylindrosporum]